MFDDAVEGEETSIERLGALWWCCELMELLVCDEFEVSLNTDVSSPLRSLSGGGVAYKLAIIFCNREEGNLIKLGRFERCWKIILVLFKLLNNH